MMDREDLEYFWEVLKVNVSKGMKPEEALKDAVADVAFVFEWHKAKVPEQVEPSECQHNYMQYAGGVHQCLSCKLINPIMPGGN